MHVPISFFPAKDVMFGDLSMQINENPMGETEGGRHN